MSKEVTNYAQALVQHALGNWVEQLTAVVRTMQRNPNLAATLSDSNSPPSNRSIAVRQLLPANASPEVIRFVHLLAQRGDITLMEEVIRKVRNIVPALDEKSNILVKSAQELDEKERNKLEQKLRHEHGEELQVRYEVEPALLGGLRIHIGDQVIDHSVAARLDALRERLVG